MLGSLWASPRVSRPCLWAQPPPASKRSVKSLQRNNRGRAFFPAGPVPAQHAGLGWAQENFPNLVSDLSALQQDQLQPHLIPASRGQRKPNTNTHRKAGSERAQPKAWPQAKRVAPSMRPVRTAHWGRGEKRAENSTDSHFGEAPLTRAPSYLLQGTK